MCTMLYLHCKSAEVHILNHLPSLLHMVTHFFLGHLIFHSLDFTLALILHHFEVVPTYLLTYLLTYSLHAAESFLTS